MKLSAKKQRELLEKRIAICNGIADKKEREIFRQIHCLPPEVKK